MSIEYVSIRIPETLEAADAGPFREMVRILNASCRRTTGTDLFDEDPVDLLARFRNTRYWTIACIAARAGDEILGVATVAYEKQTERTAELDVALASADVDERIADALLAQVETIARVGGRTAAQLWTVHPTSTDGALLASPTGAGSVPRDDVQTQRFLRRGYALGQVERASVLDLGGPLAGVHTLYDDARAAAGTEYRVVSWAGETPPEHAAGYAAGITRMTTDVPLGDLSEDVSVWDAERVFDRDRRHAAHGTLIGVTIAVHEPTQEVAAFTEFFIGTDRTSTTHQWGTLVLPEHRGRRLGSLVKCANLLNWREIVPDSPRIVTFNAEENRHMLDVNERVGFVPAGSVGAWEKALDATPLA
ncbi:GNAT family N-acetyltransferase [Microbacterium sp. G2-8]|uniref:GNAT family N-acetyltransferase n=1 Tax=Microbacterium sp. G2-8 TaxID=2842454 RepID=UPI001C892C0F|nr:GNAT family N-acetyltransferase [Microbacterium sp. G2-8]